jgi:hypothetical protein
VKWRARLPVWYGDGAEVDVSREVPGEVFVDSPPFGKGNYIVDSPQRNPKGCKESSRWSESARPPGRRYYWVGTPEGCQNFRCSDLLR